MRPRLLGVQKQGIGNAEKGDYFLFLAIEAELFDRYAHWRKGSKHTNTVGDTNQNKIRRVQNHIRITRIVWRRHRGTGELSGLSKVMLGAQSRLVESGSQDLPCCPQVPWTWTYSITAFAAILPPRWDSTQGLQGGHGHFWVVFRGFHASAVIYPAPSCNKRRKAPSGSATGYGRRPEIKTDLTDMRMSHHSPPDGNDRYSQTNTTRNYYHETWHMQNRWKNSTFQNRRAGIVTHYVFLFPSLSNCGVFLHEFIILPIP